MTRAAEIRLPAMRPVNEECGCQTCAEARGFNEALSLCLQITQESERQRAVLVETTKITRSLFRPIALTSSHKPTQDVAFDGAEMTNTALSGQSATELVPRAELDEAKKSADYWAAEFKRMADAYNVATARLEQMDQGQGEPVAWAAKEFRSGKWAYIWHSRDDVEGWAQLQHQSRDDVTYTIHALYTAPQPAPAVKLPKWLRIEGRGSAEGVMVSGVHRIRELNPGITFAEEE